MLVLVKPSFSKILVQSINNLSIHLIVLKDYSVLLIILLRKYIVSMYAFE